MSNFTLYLVGGAIRDKILKLHVKELDWLVVGSDFKFMLKIGFKLVGKDFPVFLHPINKEEYALARKERKVSIGYKGFKCNFSSDVSLNEDLLRRDLTINAIVLTEYGFLLDPFNGEKHLNKYILSHVSLAFSEDPLRVLRLARFVTKYKSLGFFISFDTYILVKKIVLNGEIKNLVLERLLKEIFLSLNFQNALMFFSFLYKCRALKYLFFDLYMVYNWSFKFRFNCYIDLLLHLNNILLTIFNYSNNSYLKFSILFLNLKSVYFSCSKILYKKNHLVFSVCKNSFNFSKRNYKFIIFLDILRSFYYRFFLLNNLTVYFIFNKINAYKDKIKFVNLLLICDIDLKLNFNVNTFYTK